MKRAIPNDNNDLREVLNQKDKKEQQMKERSMNQSKIDEGLVQKEQFCP